MSEHIGFVIGETARAWFFQDHYWSAPDWMPKSQTTLYRDTDTMEVRLVTSPWLEKVNDLKEFEYREVVPYNG